MVMNAFQATKGGRFSLLATLVDEDADFDSMVTHFNKVVPDTATERLANGFERGNYGLTLKSLIFVAEDET